MKKIIIMSLAFFALALVGCKESEQKKCEKQDGKKWVNDECVDETPAQTQADCEKDGTMKWVAANAEGQKCVAKTQAECTGDTVEWKENKCVVKGAQQTEATYSILNTIAGRTVTVSSGTTAIKQLTAPADATSTGGCVLVKASQVATLKVVVDAVAASPVGKTPVVAAQALQVLCDNTANPKVNCHAFNGQAKLTDQQLELRQAEAIPKAENCTEVLGAPAAAS